MQDLTASKVLTFSIFFLLRIGYSTYFGQRKSLPKTIGQQGTYFVSIFINIEFWLIKIKHLWEGPIYWTKEEY